MKKSVPSNSNEVIGYLKRISILMSQAKFSDALTQLDECEKKFSDDINLTLNKAGLFIDIGFYLNDIETVERGVTAGEACLADESFKEYRAMLLYNVANGIQFRIRKYLNDNDSYFGVEADIRRCIEMFRESIELTGDSNAMVNLGNLYDETGRALEAIVEYGKATQRDAGFGMAYGNNALAIKKLAHISDYQTAYLIHAYQLFNEALAHEQSVMDEGGQYAIDSFEQNRDEIKVAFEKVSKEALLDTDLAHHPFDKSKTEQDEGSYAQFCLDNDLYLNLHIFDRHSMGSVGDNISPSFITGIKDEAADQWVKETFMRLNEIKESYITGRYILWLSQQKNDSLSNISQQSLFVNNLDYTAHNIYTGLLKSAYKEGFSALDKIANTLNHYLKLGNNEKKINYRNIWFTKLDEKKGFNPSVTSQNYLLFGLYSALYALGDGPDKTRNSLEHRYFKVSTLGNEDAPTFDEFTKQTIEAYYQLKCAIVYLLNFISSCEEKKRQEAIDKGGIIPTMPVITDQWLDLW